MNIMLILTVLSIFATITIDGRLIGNDPKTWSPSSWGPKNIADNNIVLGNNTDTWTPKTTELLPISTDSSIILEELNVLDKVDNQIKLPKLIINKHREDESLPKFISNIINWFKLNKTQIQYNNRRFLL